MSEFAANGERQAIGTRGAGYGLDAELARKAAANYDYNAEAQAREWIESVVGVSFDSTFAASLKDGTLLCMLANAIKPDTIKRINNSKMPFKQMENVSAFLKACRAFGVAEHSLFETVDLYEEKDMGLVVKCLFALGSTVQTTVPTFQGPHLGARQNKINKREWTPEQVAKGKLAAAYSKQSIGSSATMERLPIVKHGITMGAESAGIGDTSTMAMSSMGSYGIMDRADISRSGICFGADSAGPSLADAAVPKASLGSAGVMARSEIVKQGITAAAEYSGKSVDANSIAQANLGSYKIMERPEIVRQGITMGAECSGPSVADAAVPKASMGSAGVMARSEVVKTGITAYAEYAGPSVADAPLQSGSTHAAAANAPAPVAEEPEEPVAEAPAVEDPIPQMQEMSLEDQQQPEEPAVEVKAAAPVDVDVDSAVCQDEVLASDLICGA